MVGEGSGATSDIEIGKEHKGTVLQLRIHQSHVGLYKKVHVDLTQHPYLAWEWKVTELPVYGDAREGQRNAQTDGEHEPDQAMTDRPDDLSILKMNSEAAISYSVFSF